MLREPLKFYRTALNGGPSVVRATVKTVRGAHSGALQRCWPVPMPQADLAFQVPTPLLPKPPTLPGGGLVPWPREFIFKITQGELLPDCVLWRLTGNGLWLSSRCLQGAGLKG